MTYDLLLNLILILIGAGCGLLFGFFIFKRRGAAEIARQSRKTNDVLPAHELLLAATEKIGAGVVLVGENLRVLGANGAARQIFNQVSDRLEGSRLTDLTRSAAVHKAFENAVAGGERSEISFETGGAEKRIFELSVTPIAFGAEDKPSAIGVFYEITKLEKLETVRQEFLSNVSHELRTPLTSILAFVETLADGAIDDAENNRRFLEIIRKNAERMRRLINDILELSAIESGKIELQMQEIRLGALVEEIKTNLAANAAARRVSIENRVAPAVRVFADAARLEQMLTNLMDNAVKFNSAGGAVTISCEPNGGRDLIRVFDTGEGIAPEHAERIFERFYRVDRARSRDLGGTGLGLSIVKHLARMHGGEARVESKLGEGTTFTIELPKFEKNADAADSN